MKILITGATGFIGKALSRVLIDAGLDLRIAVRQGNDKSFVGCQVIKVGDIDSNTDWQNALVGVDVVIHLAGRAHMLNNKIDSLADFRRVNVFGTQRLAEAAVLAGVKRFIFISSIKVNGEGSLRPYTENDIPAPKDAYGISKREAEDLLLSIAAKTGLQTVILRLPLVYGPEVKANFNNLIEIAGAGLPLPFKSIHNLRSFLYIGNLTDAIFTCITHPLAAGQIFLVSDGQDISTPDLIKMIVLAMDKKPVLFPLHPAVLKMLGKMAGKAEEVRKLSETLLVDSSKIRNLLGWKPPFTLEEGINETIKPLCRTSKIEHRLYYIT